jgi:AcrR family transcriptional regulator
MRAALELFIGQGFQSTSVRQVAERAEVAEQTIYSIFRDKIGLLRDATAYYVEAAGNDADARLLDALRREPDPLTRIRIAARDSRQTWEGTALELELMVLNANSTDSRLKDLERMARQFKLEGAMAVCEILFPDEIRRPDFSLEQIAEVAAAVDSAATVTSLVKMGWTMDQWESWVADFLTHFLAPEWLDEHRPNG